ncbi:hypothetical protein BDF19DRAFT_455385 [Syncephalis fuscata]|nr:hypothetical protein BDF19DRAFT_455385 [Syncephalis fuscata]
MANKQSNEHVPLCIAYANRSAALIEVASELSNKYDKHNILQPVSIQQKELLLAAKHDVIRALSLNYPNQRASKLYLRYIYCLQKELIAQNTTHELCSVYINEIEKTFNTALECAKNAATLEERKQFTSKIIKQQSIWQQMIEDLPSCLSTKRDSINKFISQKSPQIKLDRQDDQAIACIDPSVYRSVCEYCLCKLPFDYISCKVCPDAFYCSISCRDAGWTAYHKYEYDGWPRKYLLLEDHKKELPPLIQATDQCIALLLTQTIGLNQQQQQLLLRCQALVRYNAMAIRQLQTTSLPSVLLPVESSNNEVIAVQTEVVVGHALYRYAAMLNHSCQPNAFLFLIAQWLNSPVIDKGVIPGIWLSLRPTAPINNGEPIYISYGPLAAAEQIDKRKAFLETRYLFSCHCFACRSTDNTIGLCYKKDIDSCEQLKILKQIEELEARIAATTKIYNRYSINVGKTLDCLALAYATLGNMEMAVKYSKDSLEVVKTTMARLALRQQERLNYHEFNALWKEAIELHSQLFGAMHPETQHLYELNHLNIK